MRAGRRLLSLVGLGAAPVIAAGALAATVSWGSAIEVPGTAHLNVGGVGILGTVSCASAGNCAAGGNYRDHAGNDQAFLVNEANGIWGKAVKVPGMAALSHGNSELYTMSCVGAGFCAAGGRYDGRVDGLAFVATEVHGVWRKAIEVPGLAAFAAHNGGGFAQVNEVSCSRAGFCKAGGMYFDDNDGQEAFVVSEKHGIWRKAINLPGFAALNRGDGGWVNSISCATPRSCAAGGTYTDAHGRNRAFVVSEQHGVWGKPIQVPGLAALNQRALPGAVVYSVSCGEPGTCAAGGYYTDGSGNVQAFVVNEVNGIWSKAIEVPGSAALNVGGGAVVGSISCAADSCAAGGSYADGSHPQAFVVNEVDGVWGDAVEVPGSAALNAGGEAAVYSISCARAGSCAAGGSYTDGSNLRQAFVVSETNGVWSDAVEVPGTAALNLYDDPQYEGAVVYSISCVKKGPCAAGGLYTDGSNNRQPFVTSP